MNERAFSKAELFARLPPEWPEPLLPAIRAHLAAHPAKVVVLDDDPTGTQTVHDIPVLTEWSEASLRAELQKPGPGFYILTNSRAFPVEEACRINREIGERLARVALACGARWCAASCCRAFPCGGSARRRNFPASITWSFPATWAAPTRSPRRCEP